MTAADDRGEGPVHDVDVDGFTHGGEGVVRLDGKAVFVPGALPDERVRIRVVDDRRRWARAELLAVLTASPLRTTPPCPFVPDCGGCDLQHVTPAGQRELKQRVVREQLERIGALTDPPVAACLAATPATGYRAQARMHADAEGRLGFHRARSHDVVAVDRCLVLDDAAQAVRDAVGDTTGAVEAVVRGFGEAGVAVLTPGERGLDLDHVDGVDVLAAGADGALTALRGDGELTVTIAGFRLAVPAQAFFQSGPEAAASLVDAVLAAVGDVTATTVWDLYAGVGLLSLPLAAAGASVTAVEGDATAAEAARRNAAHNDLAVTVHTGSVQRTVVGAGLDDPDVVVLDPPRTGAGADVIAAVAARDPERVVYVACDPAALARDTRTLVGAGYRLQRATPLDLFPMTHHVEVVAEFGR